jgi:hypothetical protein
VEKDMSNGEQAAGDGHTITLNGTTYTKGLGVHASAEVRYNLGANCSSFTSDVGVDDEVSDATALVVFQVYGDGTLLYDSGGMGATTATKSINASVTGKNELKLIMTDGGNGINFDHGDWANAMVHCNGGSPTSTPTRTNTPTGPTNTPTRTNTPAPGGGPAGYTFCANENGTCSFSGGTASVAYGANGSFFYKSATGSIACNNATFGDPLPTVGKACYYKLTEGEAGVLSGAAIISSCTGCSNGQRAGFIGNGAANFVTLTFNVASAGNYTLTIYYLVSGTRDFWVSVNGGAGVQKTLSGTSWDTPTSTTMTVALNAGSNSFKFYNNTAYAPDLDRLVIP